MSNFKTKKLVMKVGNGREEEHVREKTNVCFSLACSLNNSLEQLWANSWSIIQLGYLVPRAETNSVLREGVGTPGEGFREG